MHSDNMSKYRFNGSPGLLPWFLISHQLYTWRPGVKLIWEFSRLCMCIHVCVPGEWFSCRAIYDLFIFIIFTVRGQQMRIAVSLRQRTRRVDSVGIVGVKMIAVMLSCCVVFVCVQWPNHFEVFE